MLLTAQDSKHMSMKRLADELNMDRSACRRWVLKQGIQPVRRRTGDSGFQVALTVTMDQAGMLKRIRVEEGYLKAAAPASFPSSALTTLAPDLSGFSDNDLLAEIQRRLNSTADEE